MKTDVAIIGGGLSGLALADHLFRAGLDFQLFEARARLGGRIAVMDVPGGRIDLGPSWIWPGQPRVLALIERLGLQVFPQYATGDLSFEDASGRVHRGMGFASMEGSYRLAGGMAGLIEGLAARLPAERIHLSRRVDGIGRDGGIHLADGDRWMARHIVLALPPRLAAGLRFEPALSLAEMRGLEAIPTWMGAHAKFVAVYDAPFWRDAGLSGDAMSRRGPLAEIHDASGPEGSPAALFGFLGVRASQRAGSEIGIEAAALKQLETLFGDRAAAPVATGFKDWAFDPDTAAIADRVPPSGHPDYGLPPVLDGLWDGRLHVASTETAPEMGGLIEGALAAAERTARRILDGEGGLDRSA